ncbi:contractile injection system protein, VgrG/Pvc8 family [Achromobacter sp. ACRQX]|uniref:contractile injection system protein, VgrG/Pvc8 family n=1 Tax=Achromobacter sp. ACRQX TaxID=2918181 RepID=UPI001EF290BE|nr:contractile injection system protein, VgrG/Pvc8 family [Achromobacter sp. ACRQX]MCG7324075.1 hypothetical protein [Achromobacter sp. ACRQX]
MSFAKPFPKPSLWRSNWPAPIPQSTSAKCSTAPPASLSGPGDTPVRYVHGAISYFVQRETGFRRTRYSAVVEPMLARLKLCSDWRIFQSLTVPQIAEAVLKAHGIAHDYARRNTMHE